MFRCKECEARTPGWEGRCSRCGAWGSLDACEPRSGPRGGASRSFGRGDPIAPVPLASLDSADSPRRPTGCAEFDRVLGGGTVAGSVIVVGGEPGIGKSTLMLAIAAHAGKEALYISGEESPAQVARRARRIGAHRSEMGIVDTTDVAEIAALIDERRPAICVVDSVQTMRSPDLDGAPGGPAQVRAAAEILIPVARRSGTTIIFVGQVTKEGGLAGPRALEHAVDVVLQFEGDRHMAIRALRGVKNRHGPTDEIGLFEMCESGLEEVRNASNLLLGHDELGDRGPGAVIGAAMEGRRALCLEVQALVTGDKRTSPRRRAQGIDPRRIELLVGTVESNFEEHIQIRDVFVNIVGGLFIRDPGLDLAIAASVLGAQWGMSIAPETILIGEVGLRGEVRGVPQITARLKEARAMGFRNACVPRHTPPLDGIVLREMERVADVFAQEPRTIDHRDVDTGSGPPETRRNGDRGPSLPSGRIAGDSASGDPVSGNLVRERIEDAQV